MRHRQDTVFSIFGDSALFVTTVQQAHLSRTARCSVQHCGERVHKVPQAVRCNIAANVSIQYSRLFGATVRRPHLSRTARCSLQQCSKRSCHNSALFVATVRRTQLYRTARFLDFNMQFSYKLVSTNTVFTEEQKLPMNIFYFFTETLEKSNRVSM